MMAAIVVCPSSFWCPQPSLEELWDVSSPRDPVAFRELEQGAQRAAGQVADQILGHHLTQVHQDAEFVRRRSRKSGTRVRFLWLIKDLRTYRCCCREAPASC